MNAQVRKTRTITEYTVDVGDGVVIVTLTPTSGGGYKSTAEIQFAPTGMSPNDAWDAAFSAVFAHRADSR